jgi:hypothetical protein
MSDMKGTSNPQGDTAPKSEKVSNVQNIRAHQDKGKEGSTEGSDPGGSPLPNSTASSTGASGKGKDSSKSANGAAPQPSSDEVCFTSAEQALEAAETVKVTGNHAFSSGKLDSALTLYQVASRHLSEARRLQTGK